MPKRKAEAISSGVNVLGKAALLDDSDFSMASEDEAGGATLKINDEYARRFEHNKKREELQKRQSENATRHCLC